MIDDMIFDYGSDPDIASLDNIDQTISQSKWLIHTNPIAYGAVETNANNTVGRGLKLQANIAGDYLGLSESEVIKKSKQIEQLWNIYTNTPVSIDAYGVHTFSQLQGIAYRTMLGEGGCLALYPEIDDLLQVKLVGASQLKEEGECLGGIKRDKNGKPIAYNIYVKHPERYPNSEAKLIKSRSGEKINISHIMQARVAGQERGIPYLAAVFDTIRKLKDYSEAELDAALLNARFTGIITSPHAPVSGTKDKFSVKLKKGNFAKLPNGYDIKFADPTRPNAKYKDFFDAIISELCMGLDIPQEVLMKYFRASYSASRGAILEGRKPTKVRRRVIEVGFCQPTYENFLVWAQQKGYLVLDGFFEDRMARMAWCAADWVADTDEDIDPLKAAKAAAARMDARLTTGDYEAKAMFGLDYTENVRRRKEELKQIGDDDGEG